MKRLTLAIAAAITLASTTGCANMTPEQQNQAAAAFVGVLAGAALGVAASRPVYQPVYVAPRQITTTDCTRWGRSISCTSY